jgi:hypothetical protein
MEMPHHWNGQIIYVPLLDEIDLRDWRKEGLEILGSTPARQFRWDGEYDRVGRLIYHEVKE